MSHSFKGGVRPSYKKEYTYASPIETPKDSEFLVFPLKQHIGEACHPIVRVGERVLMGQQIANSNEFISCPIHSSVSGVVVAIEPYETINGILEMSIVIKNDFTNTQLDKPFDVPNKPIEELLPEEIIKIARDAGIVGMGGAAFPTAVKLSAALENKVHTLIINGTECEPYITSDHRAMLEYPRVILGGTQLIMQCLGLSKAFLAIEDNKEDAIATMKSVSRNSSLEIKELKTKYPQGGEKQLIKSITGVEVPPSKLPIDVGCVVFNVDTCASLYRAVVNNTPLIKRIVTISGTRILHSHNLIVRVGTPITDLIEHCGGFTKEPKKIVVGGPMMGLAISSLDVPIMKGSNAVLAFGSREFYNTKNPTCIRCGKCVSACPMNLLPVYIDMYAQKYELSECAKLNVMDCIECGCCAFICPGRLNLVQTIRDAKQKICDLQIKGETL